MDPKLVAVIVVAVVVVLIIALVVVRMQRRAKLQKNFGPEYDRTVREVGPQKAETVLRER